MGGSHFVFMPTISYLTERSYLVVIEISGKRDLTECRIIYLYGSNSLASLNVGFGLLYPTRGYIELLCLPELFTNIAEPLSKSNPNSKERCYTELKNMGCVSEMVLEIEHCVKVVCRHVSMPRFTMLNLECIVVPKRLGTYSGCDVIMVVVFEILSILYFHHVHFNIAVPTRDASSPALARDLCNYTHRIIISKSSAVSVATFPVPNNADDSIYAQA
ncbi:hypothetical protein FF38_09095 [Lucilia cuprina]|uniref:Uncharacterized protein n=1 Tax=Lucilia cuprina TaxID=7375 RepID=A0A0L0CQR4_LUCCU|nr:hypothetical protein FF38_09095 [Lucilia cuprina]